MQDNPQTTRTSSDHAEQVRIVSKRSVENSRRSCVHKVFILILIEPGKTYVEKVEKKLIKIIRENNLKTTCKSSDHDKNTRKVSKRSV